jgi:hypothetical protein
MVIWCQLAGPESLMGLPVSDIVKDARTQQGGMGYRTTRLRCGERGTGRGWTVEGRESDARKPTIGKRRNLMRGF